MALNFTTLKFAEGTNLVINPVSGTSMDATTVVDFQERGVLFNRIVGGGSPDELVFVPWSNIKDIRQ